jgi:hypothetical protein
MTTRKKFIGDETDFKPISEEEFLKRRPDMISDAQDMLEFVESLGEAIISERSRLVLIR